MRKRHGLFALPILAALVMWWLPAHADSPGHGFAEFRGAGSYNWQVPANVRYVTLELWGGAGGGSRGASSTKAGYGGGSGAYVRTIVPVTPGATYVIQVGAGGAGSDSPFGSPGGPGEPTLFSSSTGGVLVTAGAGEGGSDTAGSGAGGVPDPGAGLSRVGHAGGLPSGYPGGTGGAAIIGSVEAPYNMSGGNGGPARAGSSFHGGPGGPGHAILSW